MILCIRELNTRRVQLHTVLCLSPVASSAKRRKVSVYRSLCTLEGWDFFPLAFDSFASPGKETRQLLGKWAAYAAGRNHTASHVEFNRIQARLSTTLWQQAALAINRRGAPLYDLSEGPTAWPPDS